MREVILLAVAVITAALAADPRCLQKTTNDSPHLIHENDCRKYYTCNENKLISEHTCSEGLEFNPLLLKCDYPRGFCTPATNKPVETVMSCDGLSDGAYYAELSDECRSFYHCKNGVPKVSKCAEGTKFDTKARKCVDEALAQCGQKHSKKDIDCTSTKAKAHKEDDCKSYTECENGKSIHKTCEGSLIFNELTNACDWPQNVICGKSAVEQRSDEVIYKDFEDEVCNGKPHGYLVGPNRNTKCGSFYLCKNGHLVEKQCGDKLIFNPKLGVCDLPENVDECSAEVKRSTLIDCSNKHHLRFQHPDDCSAYISCHLGKPRLHKCAKGQRFDDAKHSCVESADDSCSKSTSDEYLELLREAPSKKDKANSYPNFANGCRSYFDCKKSHCKERFCLRNFAYNSETLRCEPEETVFCDTTDSTDGTSNVVDKDAVADNGAKGRAAGVDCSSGHSAWYEDKTDCTRFYLCVMGNAIRQQCHSGQYFDAEKKMCRPGSCGKSNPAPTFQQPAQTFQQPAPTFQQPAPAFHQPAPTFHQPASLPSAPALFQQPLASAPTACTEGDTLPTGTNKNIYYKCIGGTWREVKCDGNLIFNPTQKTCGANPNNVISFQGDTPTKCTNNERIPNFFDKTTYYQCQNNQLTLISCPANQVFDSTSLNCTNSGSGSGSGSKNCTHGEMVPDHYDRTKFYVCYNGELRSQVCPDRMKFNPRKKFCEISNSKCGNVPHGGFEQAEGQPDKYYVCVDGEMVLQLCPEGQQFNPFLGFCSKFIPGPTPRPPPPTTTPPVLNCGAFNQGAFVPDPADETQYFICVLGKLWPQKCPDGQVFDKKILQCVNVEQPPAPGSCGPFAPGHRLPVVENGYENYYLICAMGVFILKECETGFNFNPVSQICDIPITGSTSCGRFADGEIYYNPNSDTAYFQCVNGVPMNMSCSAGFIFDSKANFCVNPCGNPTIADGTPMMDPNNDENYYTCEGGKMTGPSQPCKEGKFYQALASLSIKGCWDPNLIPAGPPGNAYAVIPIFPQGGDCGITNYYVEYYNGKPTVAKCPLGSLVYDGACMASVSCDPPIDCICA